MTRCCAAHFAAQERASGCRRRFFYPERSSRVKAFPESEAESIFQQRLMLRCAQTALPARRLNIHSRVAEAYARPVQNAVISTTA